MEHLKAIGTLIHTLREDRGITQRELAKKLGTTQSAVARIESGDQNVSARTLARISDVLGKDIVTVSDGALNIAIEGGRKLSGIVITKTSKNAAMGLLVASLLNKGKTTLQNVPRIEEVYRMIEVFQSIGVSVRWVGGNLEIKPPPRFNMKTLNIESAMRTRSVVMLAGSLIHSLPSFSLPQAGGCRLGSRTVRPHFFALEKLGVVIRARENAYDVRVPKKLSPASIVLYESGDTVTENTIIAASLIPGKTVIKFASANYQVQDLCYFLSHLGIVIEGIGTTTLIVHGAEEIRRDVVYPVMEDPIESMFFLAAAIVTRSAITITRAPIDFLELELLKLEKMGFRYSLGTPYKGNNGKTNLVDITTRPSRLKALEEKIECRPYPGLNIDNLPFFAVIATQAEGTTFIHDWVYEKRAIHYKELDRLGADTLLADPHRIYITGPTKLHPAEVVCPPALRPAAIILIGMLAAEGRSILRNIYSINRGYEDIVRRLNALGARITILKNF